MTTPIFAVAAAGDVGDGIEVGHVERQSFFRAGKVQNDFALFLALVVLKRFHRGILDLDDAGLTFQIFAFQKLGWEYFLACCHCGLHAGHGVLVDQRLARDAERANRIGGEGDVPRSNCHRSSCASAWSIPCATATFAPASRSRSCTTRWTSVRRPRSALSSSA